MRVLWYGNATYRQPNHYVPIICGRNISATCKKRSNGAVDKKQTKVPFSSVKLKIKSTESLTPMLRVDDNVICTKTKKEPEQTLSDQFVF